MNEYVTEEPKKATVWVDSNGAIGNRENRL